MRTRTVGEETLLASPAKRIACKVEIQNHLGAWEDFTTLSGIDWVMSVGGSESVDDPIPVLNCEIRRDHAGLSLAPFRGDSALNSGGTALDVGRGIRVSVAYDDWGSTPAGGDYRMVFVGIIDKLDFSQPNIQIEARNAAGSQLVDAWVREQTTYGDVLGDPLEDVIQEIIDDWAPGITLEVPVAPAYVITPYLQQAESVWDAIRALAGLIGWDVRILWNETASEFRPTLIEPDRAKTTPDWTFEPELIHDVDALALDRTWVRNSIRVTYLDSAGDTQHEDDTDATSIARYGEQWAEIIRGEGSPINTAGEASDLLAAALADLSTPVADQVVQVPYFWPVELGDLYRFSANGIHYNSNQDLAVTAQRWEIREKKARSWLSVRGKPAGFYRNWLIDGGFSNGGDTGPPAVITLATLSGGVTGTGPGDLGTLKLRYAVDAPIGYMVEAALYADGTLLYDPWVGPTTTLSDTTGTEYERGGYRDTSSGAQVNYAALITVKNGSTTKAVLWTNTYPEYQDILVA